MAIDKAYFNWSSGKDSALALYKLRQESSFTIEKLVTTVNAEFNRVSMHGLRTDLLEKQAASLGLPLHKIQLQGNVSLSEYNRIMTSETNSLKEEGYTKAIFGDIFLEDLKNYRDQKLGEVGLQGIYPLWKQDTRTLMQEFLQLGFKAITVCVNARLLDASFVGRVIDQQFLDELPQNVDPCGENGEFHTFVFDGPIFQHPISFAVGEKVLRTYTPSQNNDDCFADDPESWDNAFWFCDLIPTT